MVSLLVEILKMKRETRNFSLWHLTGWAVGALLGLLVYAGFCFSSRSSLLQAVLALAGAAAGHGLIKGLSRLFSAASNRPPRECLGAAAFCVCSLLAIFATFPIYVFNVVTFHSRVGFSTGALFAFAVVLSLLLLRRNYKLVAALLLLALLAGAALIAFTRPPQFYISQFPLLTAENSSSLHPVRIEQPHTSHAGMPLSVGKAFTVRASAMPGDVIEFDLGVVSPASDLVPLHVVVHAQGEGRRFLILDQPVPRDQKAWRHYRAGLDKLPSGTWNFTIRLEQQGQGREDFKPIYFSLLTVHPPLDPATPNTIVLIFDAMRADALGCYGSTRSRTPTLDGLAANGVIFDSALSSSSWTLPSVASILTSKLPSQQSMPPGMDWKHQTLPEFLSKHGINTAAVVSNPALWPRFNFDKGFAEYKNVSFSQISYRSAEHSIEMALDWVRDQDDRPFFLYVHVFDPHHPHLAPPPYGPIPSWRQRRPSLLQTLDFIGAVPYLYQVETLQKRDLPPDQLDDLYRRYLAEVEYCDAQTRVLVEGLKRLGRWDNTLLIITSDHGETFQERGYLRHGQNLYRELIHVPMIWNGGLVDGLAMKFEAPVSTMDLFPTIAEVMKLTPPTDIEGVSLAGALRGERPQHPVFSEVFEFATYQWLWTSMVKDGFHITRKQPLLGTDPPETHLFDWNLDPAELHDLIISRPELAEQLLTEMNDHFDHLERRNPMKVPPGEVMEGLIKQLKALGYID